MASNTNVPMIVEAPGAQWSADTFQIDDADNAIAVASADPQRRSVTVWNDADSTGTVYITPNIASKRGGIRLIPGAGYGFNHGAAIYARAEGGTALVNVVNETGWSC